ncbi:DDE superfamily endonuclease [Nitzschia inconspicua]|uniref:DDE superfamily endonuclease n=1 Tax=Nitzschia inconspicua TaxID=303405 RepID=A0A9K3LQJ0_9STRA|nr:DDE superfamily endonuclease [Nitzschia inconspicua]
MIWHKQDLDQKSTVRPFRRQQPCKQEGLDSVGFLGRQASVSNEENLRRFRSFFGVGPAAAATVLFDLNRKERVTIDHFLLAIYWLKTYQTETVMSRWWNMAEPTIRKHIWRVAELKQSLKEEKVVFGDFKNDPIFIISVDGVHCRTFEARKKPTGKVYSHKSHGPGLAYELGIAVYESRLVWINGPFDASVHDIMMFRNPDDPDSSLKETIPDGKRAIADNGYRGERQSKTAPPNRLDSQLKDLKNRARARHEAFNGRIKSFFILSSTFRGFLSASMQIETHLE